MPSNFYRYPWNGSESRFGPLLPFVGGLLVGGLFAPRPGQTYPNLPYSYQNTPQPYPPMGGQPQPYPYVPMPPYGYGPYGYQPVIMQQELPTYFTSMQVDNVDIYPYMSNPQTY